MAGNGGALELPVGTTQAAVPQAEDIAIPLLYDKTVALVLDHCSTLDTSKCATGGDGLRARARKQRTHTKHEFDDRWGPLAQWHQDSGPSLHWDTVT